MRSRRSTALALLIWLTAASTLFAGLPRFDCLCPGGERRSFGLPIVSDEAEGCCGGPCCSAGSHGPCCTAAATPAVEEQPEHDCCHAPPEQPPQAAASEDDSEGATGSTDRAADESAFSSPRCARTLAQPDTFAAAVQRSTNDANPGPIPVVGHSEGWWLPPLPDAAPAWPAWQVNRVPPPTDLVITLQHLTI